jgi:hypothetical protein
MRRNTLRIIGSIGLALATWMSASADSIMIPLEQSRSVSVDAFALWSSGGESDAQNFSDAAHHLEQFLAEPRADVATRHSAADVRASQSSRILPLRILAHGSMAIDAFSELILQGSTAGGAANSKFEVRFELTEDIEFRIDGSLAAEDASAMVELLGPSGSVFHRSLTDDGELMEMQGTLTAGVYTFSARILGSCTSEEIDSCRSAGYFNALLFLGDTVTSVESSSFAALKALYD